MSSAIDIANSALVTLGESPISSFEDSTNTATVVSVKWDIIRRSTLALHTWNFALKRSYLARTEASPEYKYAYKYGVPSDCLRVVEVYLDQDYKRERRAIYTNNEECQIKYIADITTPEEWDPLFVEAVAAKLAVELAYTIPRASGLIQTMEELYQRRLAAARHVDTSEDIPDRLDQFDSSLLGVRF